MPHKQSINRDLVTSIYKFNKPLKASHAGALRLLTTICFLVLYSYQNINDRADK
jgi:hypothetical protein